MSYNLDPHIVNLEFWRWYNNEHACPKMSDAARETGEPHTRTELAVFAAWSAFAKRQRGESCEHCGCALLPRRQEPILCESCCFSGICNDDCDHRQEEDHPNVGGEVRKVTLELHADDSLSCTFHTCCVSWDDMMNAVVRFRDKLNWEIENAAKCPMRPIAIAKEATKEPK